MSERTATPEKRRRQRWEKAFLSRLRQTGIVSRAAEAAGIERPTAYRLRDAHEDFRAEWDEALEEAADAMEVEAQRRAVEGLVRKKFAKDGVPLIDPETGQQYVEREYSDTLLIFLLKGARPEKFRDNVRVLGAGKGGEVLVKVLGAGVSMADI